MDVPDGSTCIKRAFKLQVEPIKRVFTYQSDYPTIEQRFVVGKNIFDYYSRPGGYEFIYRILNTLSENLNKQLGTQAVDLTLGNIKVVDGTWVITDICADVYKLAEEIP